MQQPCAHNCWTVGKALSIAHYALPIVSQEVCLQNFPLPINGQCVMRDGQCFFPRFDFRHDCIVALFT